MHQIFVYGTLLKGMYNYEIYCSAEHSYRRKAYVDGLLYSLKERRYPALLEGEEKIAGEIHEVSEETARKIDELESYFGEGHSENEYDKKTVTAYAEDGSVIGEVPVYFYNVRNERQKALLDQRITCNDYRKYMEQQK